MRLDAGDFEAVWQHLCARALADHAHGTLIASFVKEDGHWIQAVQPERLRVTSRLPRGKGARSLAKSLFHLEPASRGGVAADRAIRSLKERQGELMRIGDAADTSDRQVWRASWADRF
jgi:hypothetical protein